MEHTKRYTWLDLVKILACFFVIINHYHGQLFAFTDRAYTSVLFDCFSYAVCKSAVPLFVMASGYLLLNKEQSYRKILSRILRILVPMLALSLYYYIRFVGNDGSVTGFVKGLLSEPYYVHFWYLYMMVGLYLATPFVTKMVRMCSTRDLGVFLLVFLLIPSVTDLLTHYLDISFSGYFFYAFFPCALCYYVSGVFLTRIPLKRHWFAGAAALYVLSVLSLTATFFKPFPVTGSIDMSMDTWSALPVVTASISLFYCFRYLFEQKHFSQKASDFWSAVSATTFGTFLIHLFMLHEIQELGFVQKILHSNAYLGVIFVEVSCFIACSGVVYLVRKIPLARRFL